MEWNEALAQQARSLVFGKREYKEFTPEEQQIVDFYQEMCLEEDAMILPNTAAALEAEKAEQLLLGARV